MTRKKGGKKKPRTKVFINFPMEWVEVKGFTWFHTNEAMIIFAITISNIY